MSNEKRALVVVCGGTYGIPSLVGSDDVISHEIWY